MRRAGQTANAQLLERNERTRGCRPDARGRQLDAATGDAGAIGRGARAIAGNRAAMAGAAAFGTKTALLRSATARLDLHPLRTASHAVLADAADARHGPVLHLT